LCTTLVHPRILQFARPDAERIDVGAAAPQPLQQDAINLLVAEKAREGRTVVRLKWGESVRLRQRRQGSALPARARRPL